LRRQGRRERPKAAREEGPEGRSREEQEAQTERKKERKKESMNRERRKEGRKQADKQTTKRGIMTIRTSPYILP